MKRIALGFWLALAACSSSWSGSSGSYTGTITETLTCGSAAPASFQLTDQTVDVTVDGDGNATITLGGCPGQTLYGFKTGEEIDLQDSNTFSCTQTDAAGNTISLFNVGGQISYYGLDLSLNLDIFATLSGATCQGSALGQLP